MKIWKKYLALLFIGFLIYPLMYQSFHVFSHKNHLHLALISHSENSDGIESSRSEENCLVCEFKFSINNIPDLVVLEFVIPTVYFVFNTIVSPEIINIDLINKPSRAPPIFDFC